MLTPKCREFFKKEGNFEECESNELLRYIQGTKWAFKEHWKTMNWLIKEPSSKCTWFHYMFEEIRLGSTLCIGSVLRIRATFELFFIRVLHECSFSKAICCYVMFMSLTFLKNFGQMTLNTYLYAPWFYSRLKGVEHEFLRKNSLFSNSL